MARTIPAPNAQPKVRDQFRLDHLRACREQGQTLKATDPICTRPGAVGQQPRTLYSARSALKRRGVLTEPACASSPRGPISFNRPRPRPPSCPCVSPHPRLPSHRRVSGAPAQRRRRRGPRPCRARSLCHGARLRESAAMIRPPNEGIEVWLCVEPVDFRKQIPGLAALVQDTLAMDPFSAHLFVFTNRRRTQCRILYWERCGIRAVAKAPGTRPLRLAAPHRCGGQPERGATELPARRLRPVADASTPHTALRLDVSRVIERIDHTIGTFDHTGPNDSLFHGP